MEKKFDCIKLHFSTPLHLSRGREQYDESATTLHSDSLVSALFTAARQLGATVEEILAMFDGLKISSAFPFHETEFFFPKPLTMLPFKMADLPEEKQGKPFKKIRYLGKHWFERMLNAETETIYANSHLKQSAFLTDHPIKTIFKKEVIQRVTIAPDYSEDAKPFYTERLFFGEGSGLFILVEWLDEKAKNLFKSAFHLLGDMGIGTDRSVGNGFFTPSFETVTLRLPEHLDCQCNLGLYLPKQEELDEAFLEKSSWVLIKRGGYISGAENLDHFTLRKKSVYMFDVGSVFPNSPLQGNRLDLRPNRVGIEHPVWREGRPIFVPIIKLETP